MENENKFGKLCHVVLSMAYLIFSYQYANHKGSIPIIDWLPEVIIVWIVVIGIFGGISSMTFLLFDIIKRLGGSSLLAVLVGIFGCHAAWFWFLFSIRK
jgi:hypothetical protein